MKISLYAFSLIFLLISCKNEEKDQQPETPPAVEQQERNREETESTRERENTREFSENSSPEADDEQPDQTNTSRGTAQGNLQSGIYIKEGENDANCSCYCIEISNGETDLCLNDQEIYIKARIAGNDGTRKIYYTQPSSKNTNEDLPWEDFDTDTPIAEITPTSNGGIELDWKGFTINGELSVDHAIYGKKTLEGKYNKQ